MSLDSVTGLQIRSEGLLQLSYIDVPSYQYTAGDIDWMKDKAMALSDYAAGATSGNPARTLLNAYANLNLGLFIMNRLIISHPAERLETALPLLVNHARVGFSVLHRHAWVKCENPGMLPVTPSGRIDLNERDRSF